MPDGTPHPAAGHNGPPAYREDVVAAHSAKAAEFLDAAGEWLELKELTSAGQSAELNDFIAGLRKNWSACDADRKSDKKPHDEAGRQVQGAYVPILEKIKKASAKVAPMQTAWLAKVEAQRKAEAARQAAQARAAQEEADKAAAEAKARNDLSGEADAEEAQRKAAEMAKQAERTAKAPARTGSATGGAKTASLRTVVTAKLKNPRLAFMHFQDDAELHALLEQLATREARAKGFDPKTDAIQGFDILVTKKAV